MSFSSGFRGTVGGSVQSAVTDQPGVAVAGMLAFASDLNYVDALYIGESVGIAAGRGVRVAAVSDSVSLQRPNQAMYLPDGAETEADFAGILVFNEAMQSDENGVPGWAEGRIGQLAKPYRSGVRAYVRAVEAIAVTDSVYWVTTAGGAYEAGDFSGAAQGTLAWAGAGVADAGNTGDGTISAIVVADNTTAGVYKAINIEPATDAGTFEVFNPSGVSIGTATVGVEFVGGGLTFTISDGATDFVAGDTFNITVTVSGAESVQLTNARWVEGADAGGVALLELL